MNLTSTEKYALAVLEAQGKLSVLQRGERALCLAASCVWDMIRTGAVTADEKGRLRASAPLPETISYCAPVYDMLAEKPRKPERLILNTIDAGKRINALVKSVADNLIDKSVLVVEQQSGSRKVKLCHVDTTAIAEDIAAMKRMDGASAQDQVMLATLLLESGAAKKLLAGKERSGLKKAVKQANNDLRRLVRYVKKIFWTFEIAFVISIVTIVSQQLR